jgi:hypothetical protein
VIVRFIYQHKIGMGLVIQYSLAKINFIIFVVARAKAEEAEVREVLSVASCATTSSLGKLEVASLQQQSI